MRQKKEAQIRPEKSPWNPYNYSRSEELLLSNDEYLSIFGTDRELKELRKKIEARRFPAASKKGRGRDGMRHGRSNGNTRENDRG